MHEIVRFTLPKSNGVVTSSDSEGTCHYIWNGVADRKLTWKPEMDMAIAMGPIAMGAISGQLAWMCKQSSSGRE